MKKTLQITGYLSLLLLLLCTRNLGAQNYTISGYITAGETGENLIAASVYDLKHEKGTVTNNYGFFSLTLPKDSAELQVSYIGYEPVVKEIMVDRDIQLNVALTTSIVLDAVEVTATQVDRIQENVQMSQIGVPVEQIKKVPALLGEVDVLKALQLLPGVQSGGEGQTGLYVRGGSPDQNLVLLDGVPVYSVAHVAGLFSVFNADAIKNVSLIKGGFPARYGGRLSSVLEISMKDGNKQEFHGEGSIGLITSKLTLEGPINKGRTSFLISGRRTYIDMLLRPIAKSNAKEEGVGLKPKLHFYDINVKLNHNISDKHRLYYSLYNGSDVFFSRIKEERSSFAGGLDWGNWISAARWNWQISPRIFSNTTLIFSDYAFDSRIEIEEEVGDITTTFKSKYLSGIQDLGAKWDLDFIPNPSQYIRLGFGATRHVYDPGAISFQVQEQNVDLDTLIGNTKTRSTEFYLYAEDEITMGNFKMNIGLHASAFSAEDVFYSSLQPRLNFRYLMNSRWSLKASFNTMTQYINLLATEALSLPTDLWVPSTRSVRPQRAWQAAVGAAKNYNGYEISVEGYYKKMTDVVSLKAGSSFLFGLDNSWEEKITQGEGKTYGGELFLQKKTGKTTGWIGYTLSWNNRTFEEINSGRTFPFKYDRRHDLSIVAIHDFNERVSLTGSWVYGTGNAISIPYQKFNIYRRYADGGYNTNPVEQIRDKNSFRMSNFHRLDLGIRFSKQKKRHLRTWSFGAYNSYFHKNPYFVYASNAGEFDPVTGQYFEQRTKFKEVSLIPFIIPYFSYGFKF
ncbi:MAG: TonB-dependent receptor plug domain-containing protein [Saprospiraceae bacterium]|nr:TonB-dependent receptor plug domain-containing protein [Saprospiraceae bacterium]